MHLIEALSRRTEPCAGVYFTLTRRCPLSCAHCSTNSTISSEQHDEAIFTRFAETILDSQPGDRPYVAGLTGGEALLRPRLCESLLATMRQAEVKTILATGLYFARYRHIPPSILNVITRADLVMFSLDIFHEKELERDDIARVVHKLMNERVDLAVQLVGRDADDPYLADATAWILDEFDHRIPILVALLKPVGRAVELPGDLAAAEAPKLAAGSDVDPCSFASWPVIAPDGRIVACGNQDAVDTASPGHHLYLGHASSDSWADVRQRATANALLRCIRTSGPSSVAPASDLEGRASSCATCLSGIPRLSASDREGIASRMSTVGMNLIEREVAAMFREQGIVPDPFKALVEVGLS